ncbi:MAG: helix-turn-helix domain-containing protein [Thermoproteota archaeon]
MVLVVEMEEKEEEAESLEQEVFKALDHQKRRDILRFIGERKDSTFTEILNASKVSDSPTLSYHLRILAPFIEQREGKIPSYAHRRRCIQPSTEDSSI